jgi:hypothetical protein
MLAALLAPCVVNIKASGLATSGLDHLIDLIHFFNLQPTLQK